MLHQLTIGNFRKHHASAILDETLNAHWHPPPPHPQKKERGEKEKKRRRSRRKKQKCCRPDGWKSSVELYLILPQNPYLHRNARTPAILQVPLRRNKKKERKKGETRTLMQREISGANTGLNYGQEWLNRCRDWYPSAAPFCSFVSLSLSVSVCLSLSCSLSLSLTHTHTRRTHAHAAERERERERELEHFISYKD